MDDERVTRVDDWSSNGAFVTCFVLTRFDICMGFVDRVCGV